MRIGSLNLQHGGGTRNGRLADYLCDTNADLLVLTEIRDRPSGTPIREVLMERGYSHQTRCYEAARNAVAIVSREPLTMIELEPPAAGRNRIVAAGCRTGVIVGVYFAQGQRKASLFNYLLSELARRTNPSFIVGDFNTGIRRIDGSGSTCTCADRFQALLRDGWTDAWRLKNGEAAREYSWFSHAGNGYRVDHALVSRVAAHRVIACRYDHSIRGVLTDHSALVLDVL